MNSILKIKVISLSLTLASMAFGTPTDPASCEAPVGRRVSEPLLLDRVYDFGNGMAPISLHAGAVGFSQSVTTARIYQKASLIANGNNSWWSRQTGTAYNEIPSVRVFQKAPTESGTPGESGQFLVTTREYTGEGWKLVDETILTLHKQRAGDEVARPAQNATGWSRFLEGNNQMYDYFTPISSWTEELHFRLYVRSTPQK